jgi:phosphoribosylcarboxyaminoimidazole (NCAIR) mutase
MVSWPTLRSASPQRPIIGRPVGSLALQGVLATFQEVVAPGGQPVGLDPELARQLLERLAALQPEHRLHLLAG